MNAAEGAVLTKAIIELILLAKTSGVSLKEIEGKLKEEEARHSALVARFQKTRKPRVKKLPANPVDKAELG